MSTAPSASVPARILYEPILRRALMEDLGGHGDVTTDAITAAESVGRATIFTRTKGRVAGLPIALDTFALLDPAPPMKLGNCNDTADRWPRVEIVHPDGTDVDAGTALAHVTASHRALLGAERTALNLLGHLSGIATMTQAFVRAIKDSSASIVCTRKTTPGLRTLEKYAVRVGGGRNHRFGLDDGVLIKDNHVALVGSVQEAVHRIRRETGHMVKIEVEVDTLQQLDEVLELEVDAVLLDNMDRETLFEAVRRIDGRILTEASGSVTIDKAAEVAGTGVEMISVGRITHSAPALDVTMELQAS